MKYTGKIFLALVACIFMHVSLHAQPLLSVTPPSASDSTLNKVLNTSDSHMNRNLFYVSNIIITGNRKTKPYYIERELTFKRGDSLFLNDLVDRFERARNQLMNTRLFNEVVVSLKRFRGYEVDVEIDVKERWYIFPIPYFKPVDRNLSEWAKQGYNPQRSNYGLKFTYYNFTGRNDRLRALFIIGYTKQVQFSYEQPYADKALKHGYGVSISYLGLKEINHLTLNNEQKFFPVDSLKEKFANRFINQQFNLGLSYTYRPAIRTKHAFRASFNFNKIDSSVWFLNPRYFNNSQTQVLYPEFSYTIDYNNVDYIAYPLKGFFGEATMMKRGVNKDMNMWMLAAKGTRSWEIGKKLYFGVQGTGVVKLPLFQPYYNQRLFGYGDLYLRGLEKYVIDGVVAGMIRNTFRREILNFSVPFIRSKSHDRIPFRFFLKTYADIGYAYNKNTFGSSLENRMLYTTGAGIDLLSFYDFVLRFEYSFNQLGENGIFIHVRNDF